MMFANTVENDSTHLEDGLTWDQLTHGRPFITNLGYQPNYTQPNPNGPPMLMGRFAAFLPLPDDQSRHQIVEVSHDLDYLKHKYAVTDDAIFQVNVAAS